MKLTALALTGLLATIHCPGSSDAPLQRDLDDCWTMTASLPLCDPGVAQINPRFDPALGFNKRYYETAPQTATVASVSGARMVLEGPWDMPYTFTWFEPLGDLFAVGDEVELSGGQWNLVAGPRGSVAHANLGGFSVRSPRQVGKDGPDVAFYAACEGPSEPVWGVTATVGDETVSIAQGERGSVAGWEILHHGAASSPGYEEDCMVAEGYFHGAVSAWTTLSPAP